MGALITFVVGCVLLAALSTAVFVHYAKERDKKNN